jgi:PKD repeat protein
MTPSYRVPGNGSERSSRLFAAAALFVAAILVATRAFAGSVTLAWDPVTSPALAGYVLHSGPAAGNYTTKIDVGNVTSRAIANLAEGATYHFAVTAYDASGTQSSFSNDVAATIGYSAPVANFTASASSGVAPLALNFTSTSDGNIASYAWTFGDGTGSTAANPSHVYASPGIYSVALSVTGPGGTSAKTASNLISVQAPPDGTPPGASLNVALAVNGGVASASSTLRASNSVMYVNDDRRSGSGWSTGGGGWADATLGAFPDWVQIAFDGVKTIDHVVVYSVQDDFQNPVEPTATTTFTKYGLTAFQVQGWNGSTWVTLASVAGNNLVERTVSFAPTATDRVRVRVTGVADGAWSRITEIEAWTATSVQTTANYALAANGGVATASSTLRAANGVAYVNDGQRSGAGWSTGGGGWADATSGAFPDWVQIAFNGARTLDHVVVYSVQDDFQHPLEPGDTMAFTLYGLTEFDVQGWSGSAWVTLANVSGNSLVKRSVAFSPYTTDRIRVLVTGVADGAWSRITEIEAWGR